MSNLEDYNSKIDVIKAISDDRLKNPNSIPMGIFIQEAEDMYAWCQGDKEELMAKGLDWTVVEDLPIRCGALREAESRWQKERFTREEAEKIWLMESPQGHALRDELAHHFYYAFSDDLTLIGKVNRYLEGTSHADMIQGLNDLSVLGNDNQELLTKIGVDLTLLDLAAKKSDELAPMYSAASRDRQEYSDMKKIRDQAFTYVKEAVDLIRKCGQYAYWRNAARVKGYRSNYLRKIRRRNTQQTEPGTEPVPVTNPA